jgi:hypothetical protein
MSSLLKSTDLNLPFEFILPLLFALFIKGFAISAKKLPKKGSLKSPKESFIL